MRDSVEAWLEQKRPVAPHLNSPWLKSQSNRVVSEGELLETTSSNTEVPTAYMESPIAAAYTTARAVRPSIVIEEEVTWSGFWQQLQEEWRVQLAQPVLPIYWWALAVCVVVCSVVSLAWPVNVASKVEGTALQALQEELSSEAPLEGARLAVAKPDEGSLPNFNRHDPFEPLLSTAAIEDAAAMDPLNGFSFMGLIRGDGKTKDVVIVEVPSLDPAGAPETVIQPLGTSLERLGASVKLLRCNENELTVSVNGQTRQLALVNVVDELAAAASNHSSAAGGAVPRGNAAVPGAGQLPSKGLGEDPNGDKLLNSLDR